MAAPSLLLAALLASTPATDLFERSTPAVRVLAAAEGLPPTPAAALVYDAQGFLWIGTQNGLYVGEGRAFRPVQVGGLDATMFVQGLVSARDGSLWVATSANGVFRLKDRQWTAFAAGLPSMNVHALAEF